jgi:hypothetical protein
MHEPEKWDDPVLHRAKVPARMTGGTRRSSGYMDVLFRKLRRVIQND